MHTIPAAPGISTNFPRNSPFLFQDKERCPKLQSRAEASFVCYVGCGTAAEDFEEERSNLLEMKPGLVLAGSIMPFLACLPDA